MTELILNALQTFSGAGFSVFVVFILANWKNIKEIAEKWRESTNEREQMLDDIKTNKGDIKTCLDEIHTYQSNRQKDQEQSLQIQKEFTEAIEKINEKLDDVIEKNIRAEEKHNQRVRAELKDKIGQAYRKCHKRKGWTKIEKESLNGLIKQYEEHDGVNSFVHEIVVPESYTWDLLEEDDAD